MCREDGGNGVTCGLVSHNELRWDKSAFLLQLGALPVASSMGFVHTTEIRLHNRRFSISRIPVTLLF